MATNYNTANLTVFPNKVIQTKLENQLATKLDMNNFITTDYSLLENAGRTVDIYTYVGKGDVEAVAMGEGNTGDIGAEYTTVSYEVETIQGRVPYFDEQQQVDPKAIDAALTRLSTMLTNDLTKKIVGELAKGTQIINNYGFDFGGVSDAIAMFGEDKDGLYMLINSKDASKLRKTLKDDLKYVEDFSRTGYVGHVCGVPVSMSDAVPEGTAFVANREAVTCFVKKGVRVAQEREENTRKNIVYGRVDRVVALTNNDKVVVLKAAE